MQPDDVRLDVYDDYADFMHAKYFAVVHGVHPSKVTHNIAIERLNERYAEILETLQLATFGLESLMESTNLSKNKEESDPFGLAPQSTAFYVSDEAPLALQLGNNGSSLDLTFYYDVSRPDLKAWCIERLRAVHAAFGKKDVPQFSVLTRQHGFDTEAIDIVPLNLDLATHYNEDFTPVDQAIQQALQAKDRSGLILLHGTPGTGKTSYIKHLIATHPKTKFIFVPNDLVRSLLQPDFVSFMVTQRKSVLVIEDAEKVIQSRETTGEASVVSTILQLTDGLFSDYLSIKVICTFNTDVSRIDPALFRKGRLIGFYEFKPLASAKTEALLTRLGKSPSGKTGPMTLAEIYNYDETGYGDGRGGRRIGFGG